MIGQESANTILAGPRTQKKKLPIKKIEGDSQHFYLVLYFPQVQLFSSASFSYKKEV